MHPIVDLPPVQAYRFVMGLTLGVLFVALLIAGCMCSECLGAGQTRDNKKDIDDALSTFLGRIFGIFVGINIVCAGILTGVSWTNILESKIFRFAGAADATASTGPSSSWVTGSGFICTRSEAAYETASSIITRFAGTDRYGRLTERCNFQSDLYVQVMHTVYQVNLIGAWLAIGILCAINIYVLYKLVCGAVNRCKRPTTEFNTEFTTEV